MWLSYRAFKATEDHLRATEAPDHREAGTSGAPSGSTSPFLGSSGKDKEVLTAEEGEMGYLPQLGAGEGSYGQGAVGDSVDDLLYGQGGGPSTPGFAPYNHPANQSTNAFDTVRSSGHFSGFGQHGYHDSTFSLQPPSAPYLAGLHGGSQRFPVLEATRRASSTRTANLRREKARRSRRSRRVEAVAFGLRWCGV